MYDDLTTEQLRDALALRDEQNACLRQVLEATKSLERLERQRILDLEARLAVERARSTRGRRRLRFW